MSENHQLNELHLQTSDYVAIAAKSVLGGVPFAGSLLSELAGVVIPNQRIERIVKFAEILNSKLSGLEHDVILQKLTNNFFTDMMEEGVRQAARSLSDERRIYLASVIANGLSSEDVDFVESRHLMRILGEINDIEVIWLAFYSDFTLKMGKEFREKYSDIITPIQTHFGVSQELNDKSTLQESYKQHLVQLNLLKYKYKLDPRTKQPEFDTSTGEQKIQGYEISTLGRLLIRQIDFEKMNING